jgi:hypothetical protein
MVMAMKREVYDVTDYGSDDELHNAPIVGEGETFIGPVRLLASRQVAYFIGRSHEFEFEVGDTFRDYLDEFALTLVGIDGSDYTLEYTLPGRTSPRRESCDLGTLLGLRQVNTSPTRHALLAEYQIFQHDTYHAEGGMGMAASDRAAASLLHTAAVRRLVDERAEKKRRSEMLPVDWGDDD